MVTTKFDSLPGAFRGKVWVRHGGASFSSKNKDLGDCIVRRSGCFKAPM